jgi:hypothetical protein
LPYDRSEVSRWILKHVFWFEDLELEAKENIGVVATFFTLFVLLVRFRFFGKKWSEAAYHRVNKNYLNGMFFSAAILLFLALGFPFKIPGLEWMVEYIGPLRQFRGLGRFVWAYYYVINIIAFYAIWNYSTRFKGFKNKYLGFKWVIALAPLAILLFESYDFQRIKPIKLIPNYAKRSIAANGPDHWLNKVDFSKFQAIMPLPYYHIGSENMLLEINYWLYKKVYYTALHTGVPDIGVFLSRTPLGETSKSIQLALTPFEPSAILDDFPDNRPIALLIEPKELETIKGQYAHLLEHAVLVYDSPELRIMSVNLESIRAYPKFLANLVRTEMLKGPLVPVGNPWMSNVANSKYYYQSYDSLTTTDLIFQGKGAYVGKFTDTTDLFNGYLPKGRYRFSVWLKSDRDMNINPGIWFEEKETTSKVVVKSQHEGPLLSVKGIIQGWGLVDLGFEVVGDHSNVRVFIEPRAIKGNFYLDEVLLQSDQYYLYRDEPKWVVRNNYWYKLE